MIRYRVTDTIASLDRDAWDALFPSEIERYDYLLAIEQSGLAGFRWLYALAEDDGRLVGAAPGFLTEYALDTTLTGLGRRIVATLRRLAPGALTLRLACIGSPCTETILIGFDPSATADSRSEMFAGLLGALDAAARVHSCGLLALKDIPATLEQTWREPMRRRGYSPVPGLPVASLTIATPSIDAYLAQLSASTRKDMRRKLRTRDQVRVERRRNIDDVIDKVLGLYNDTRGRADMQFEELTPAYFQGVLARVPGAHCTLYFAGDELLAANLLIESGGVLLDKFFCMNAAAGRTYNLYFLSWFENVRYCIQNRLERYQSGQAAYVNKLRLGSRLTPTTMYFKHRNFLINGALQAAAPLFTGALAPEQAA